MTTTIENPAQVYREKGLNGLYAFLRKNKINYTTRVESFGLQGQKTWSAKQEWLEERIPGTIRMHYHSRLIHSRGWNYNLLRGIEIVFL